MTVISVLILFYIGGHRGITIMSGIIILLMQKHNVDYAFCILYISIVVYLVDNRTENQTRDNTGL